MRQGARTLGRERERGRERGEQGEEGGRVRARGGGVAEDGAHHAHKHTNITMCYTL